MKAPQSQQGFTLVEVMVAITILSLIMLLLVAGLRGLGGTQTSIQRVVDRADQVRTVSAFLRDSLETAVVGGDSNSLVLGGGASETTYFRFQKDSLEWKSRILFGENYGGSYFLRLAPEGEALVLRWQDSVNFSVPEDWQDAPHRVMLESLEELQLSIREDFGAGWETPEDQKTPPQLVRIQIKSLGRYWPELIVPVQR